MSLFACLSEIGSNESNLSEVTKNTDVSKIDTAELDKPLVKVGNQLSRCPLEGHGGTWDGERGESNWVPDIETKPGDRNGTNPENKHWKEILDKYEIESIPFKDCHPDFSEISKGSVEIDDFSSNRDSNFDQADEKLAQQRGCTPEEVAKWRKENGYTWHECEDCKTMQKVPTEVHGNIPHSGGISEAKSRENANIENTTTENIESKKEME